MVVGRSSPRPPPTAPGVQPNTATRLQFWVATGELPLLLPDVQNLQEREQCQTARQGAPDNPAVPGDKRQAGADEQENRGSLMPPGYPPRDTHILHLCLLLMRIRCRRCLGSKWGAGLCSLIGTERSSSHSALPCTLQGGGEDFSNPPSSLLPPGPEPCMGKKNRGQGVARLCRAVLEARRWAGLLGSPWEADRFGGQGLERRARVPGQQPRLNARTQMLEEGRKAPGS